MMVKSVVIHRHGGPEVMQLEELPLAPPGPGEVRLRHTAIGINYIDVYHRSGAYPLDLPGGLGLEGVGLVEAVGAAVSAYKPGDRVAYISPPAGSYARLRNYPAERLISLPPTVDDEVAAAGLFKGMTAWYLLRRTRRLLGDERVLVHAAAGGVGHLLVQLATHYGATVYGVVGTEEKAEQAREDGCEAVYLADEDYVTPLQALGGVDVVYDAVGAATFEASLDCLRPLGMMVSYGNASGAPPAIAPAELGRRGSLFLTRPSLLDYMRAYDDLQHAGREVCELLAHGVLRPRIGQRWELDEVVEAHRALEARQTRGAAILLP